jgi:hypothetical protein
MSEQEEKEEQPVVRRDATVTVTAITVAPDGRKARMLATAKPGRRKPNQKRRQKMK